MKEYFYSIITEQPKGPLGFALKFLLIFISLFYLLAVKLRLGLYNLGIFKSCRLRSPVISVGNITWGGTGKTPLVEAICLYFKSHHKRVALLTRGYGMDEDKVLTESMPGVSVLVGKDRIKNAGSAEERCSFDIFVLDDGFQHKRIKRDIDIVAINATDPFGSGLLIPAGILREPISHLSRADLVVITRSDLVGQEELNRIKDDVLRVNPDVEIFGSTHQPVFFYTSKEQTRDPEYIKAKQICAISALGDNHSFAKTLKNMGADIKLKFFYMDHHRYLKEQIDEILKVCEHNDVDTVVTTQKDWIKLKGLLTTPSAERIEFLILHIKLKLYDEEGFFGRLSSVLSG